MSDAQKDVVIAVYDSDGAEGVDGALANAVKKSVAKKA